MAEVRQYKRPESVLVVVYTPAGSVLLLERREPPGFWQSVTGSLRWDEQDPKEAAMREVYEETGLRAGAALRDLNMVHRFPIVPPWRSRYAPEDRENLEHAFALALPAETDIKLNPAEHRGYGWFGFDAAAAKVTSWTNRDVIVKVKALL